MRHTFRIKGTPAVVLGIVALVVAASGVSFAASRDAGSITACVHKHGGGLYRAAHCAKGDGKLTWSTEGARGPAGRPGAVGPRGSTGPQGPQGNPGSARGFAYVKADGTVLTKGGSIDIAIDKVKTGEYCLIMNPKPDPATFVPILATIQGPDLTAGFINVNTATGSDCNVDGGVGVFTMNTAGKAADFQFVVAVL